MSIMKKMKTEKWIGVFIITAIIVTSVIIAGAYFLSQEAEQKDVNPLDLQYEMRIMFYDDEFEEFQDDYYFTGEIYENDTLIEVFGMEGIEGDWAIRGVSSFLWFPNHTFDITFRFKVQEDQTQGNQGNTIFIKEWSYVCTEMNWVFIPANYSWEDVDLDEDIEKEFKWISYVTGHWVPPDVLGIGRNLQFIVGLGGYR